jgi:hypothetical protein
MAQGRKLSVENLLAQATCAVLIDSKVAGTAWLFSREGHLLTAGHVLGPQKPLTQVEVHFPEDAPRLAYRVQHVYAYESGIDFAILKLTEPPVDRFPLPIALPELVEGRLIALGYGKSLVDRSSGTGIFAGFFDPQNSSANRLFKLESTQLGEPGYSGCAIFSKESGAVVAIQIEATHAKTGAERDTVLAMPLYRVAYLWPALTHYVQRTTRESDLKSDEQNVQRMDSTMSNSGISFRARDVNVSGGNFILGQENSITNIDLGTYDSPNDNIGQNYSSLSLSPNLYKHLQETLLTCGPFDDDAELRAVFIDSRINAWRNAVPQVNSPIKRVRAVIDLLHNQYSSDPYSIIRENALVLFLRVLSDQVSVRNVCHRDLLKLAEELDVVKTLNPQLQSVFQDKSPVIEDERQDSPRRQLATHRKNLNRLEEQLAKYGQMDAPLRLLSQIEDEQTEIRRLERLLNGSSEE